jgi:hypothetical protein
MLLKSPGGLSVFASAKLSAPAYPARAGRGTFWSKLVVIQIGKDLLQPRTYDFQGDSTESNSLASGMRAAFRLHQEFVNRFFYAEVYWKFKKEEQ